MVEKSEDWERFGRASKASAPEIVKLNEWRASPASFDVASYRFQVWIHRAHVVMLCEQEIITREEALQILRGLDAVEKQAAVDKSLVGYMSTETALIKEIGEVGGKMHTARSRNDLGHTQRRLYYRDQTQRLIASVNRFRDKLLEKAEENKETYMPGYTHWRQAQPVTLGHYMLAHVEAAGRTVERLEGVYDRCNLSPMGAAAHAGTGWPIDRWRTMELLGFRDLVYNSQDAVATVDYIMELASAVAIHMSNLSRLSEDLQVWSSDEFKLVYMDETYAGTSSIMPQKKNPLVQEQVKSYAAEAIGAMTAVVSAMKGVSYTNTVDKVMLEPMILDTAVGSTEVMAGLSLTLRPRKDQMMKKLSEGFSTMTDLADALVQMHGLSFRQAHDIVVHVTLEALEKEITPKEVTPGMLKTAATKVLGDPIDVTREAILDAVDPVKNVQRRKALGGPSPESVTRMIEIHRRSLLEAEARQRERLEQVRLANVKLREAIESLRI